MIFLSFDCFSISVSWFTHYSQLISKLLLDFPILIGYLSWFTQLFESILQVNLHSLILILYHVNIYPTPFNSFLLILQVNPLLSNLSSLVFMSSLKIAFELL